MAKQKQQYKFSLGERVRDIHSGFEGTVVIQSTHINMCNRYVVVADAIPGAGKAPEDMWVDEVSMEAVAPPKQPKEERKTGAWGSQTPPLHPSSR